MKIVTKKKVIEERVPEYEPGDIVCVDINQINHKWVIIVDEDSNGRFEGIPIEYPTNKAGFNTWTFYAKNICREFDILHVPIKGVSDVTVTEKEELEQ